MRSRNICKFSEVAFDERLSVRGFILETERSVMMSACTLDAYRAQLFISGSGFVSVSGDRIPFEKGTLFFGFKGDRLSVLPEGECEYMYVTFDGGRVDELFRRFLINDSHRVLYGQDGLIPMWRESLLRASKDNIDLAAESILLYTFSRLTGKTENRCEALERMKAFTEENFRDSELSVSVVAAELGYNAKYLSHLFKERMGSSYTEYLRTLRLKYAVTLFDHGLDSVKNVALLSGFADPLYFSTVFRESIGVSPREYIERAERKSGGADTNERT